MPPGMLQLSFLSPLNESFDASGRELLSRYLVGEQDVEFSVGSTFCLGYTDIHSQRVMAKPLAWFTHAA